MIITSQGNQNMMDLCLIGYNSLDHLVKFCTDNNVLDINYAPPTPQQFFVDESLSISVSKIAYATNYVIPKVKYDTDLDFSTNSFYVVNGCKIISTNGYPVSGVTVPYKRLEYNTIASPVGISMHMDIFVGGVLELDCAMKTDYIGNTFEYTDRFNITHTSFFASGNIYF